MIRRVIKFLVGAVMSVRATASARWRIQDLYTRNAIQEGCCTKLNLLNVSVHSSAVLRSEAICTMTNKAMTLKDHPLPLHGFLVYLYQDFAQTCVWFELKTVPCYEWESWLCDVTLFHSAPLVKVPAAIKNQIKILLAQSCTVNNDNFKSFPSGRRHRDTQRSVQEVLEGNVIFLCMLFFKFDFSSTPEW